VPQNRSGRGDEEKNSQPLHTNILPFIFTKINKSSVCSVISQTNVNKIYRANSLHNEFKFSVIGLNPF
jgi:hypothetical protein